MNESDMMLNMAMKVAGIKPTPQQSQKGFGNKTIDKNKKNGKKSGQTVISSLFTSNPETQVSDEIKQYSTEKVDYSVSNGISQSDTSFTQLGLDSSISEHLKIKMSMLSPTEIQKISIPAILKDMRKSTCDFIIQAQTGSGKSLAYILPIVHDLLLKTKYSQTPLTRDEQGTTALILCPTRELAVQVNETLSKVLSLKYQNRWIVNSALTGGESKKSEKARLRKGVTILASTPGRLLDHFDTTSSFKIENLKWIVFDEADRFLELGFQDAVKKIQQIIKSKCAHYPRTILCSATVNKQIQDMGGVKLNESVFLSLNKKSSEDEVSSMPNQLKQQFMIVPQKLRLVSLCSEIIHAHNTKKTFKYTQEEFKKSILFVSNCDSVDFYYELLTHKYVQESLEQQLLRKIMSDDESGAEEELSENKAQKQADVDKEPAKDSDETSIRTLSDIFGPFHEKVDVLRLHGSIPHSERIKTYNHFKSCNNKHVILISTDVAARGLDIPNVSYVFQYEPPTDIKDYIHRMGRTARIGQQGQGLLWLLPSETDYLLKLKQFNIISSQKDYQINLKAMLDFQKNSKINEFQEAVSNFHLKLENMVNKVKDLKLMAKAAYMSSIKSYSTHPKEMKKIFHIKNLHLGHMAKAFCIRDAPSKIKIGNETLKNKKSDKEDTFVGKRSQNVPSYTKRKELWGEFDSNPISEQPQNKKHKR